MALCSQGLSLDGKVTKMCSEFLGQKLAKITHLLGISLFVREAKIAGYDELFKKMTHLE